MVVECSIWLGSVVYGCKVYYMVHWDFKVSRFQTKVYENFAIYFLKTKANKHPESMWVVEFSIWLRSVVYGCGV